MGLDTSHDAWSGAYSAFNRWRNKLATIAGYHVEPGHIRKYSDPTHGQDDYVHETVVIDWGHVTMDNIAGEWDQMPHNIRGEPDPLLILMAHSDCDGLFRAEHCAPLADRIEELMPHLPEGSGSGHIGDWQQKTQRFIDGLRRAAEAGEDVEFM